MNRRVNRRTVRFFVNPLFRPFLGFHGRWRWNVLLLRFTFRIRRDDFFFDFDVNFGIFRFIVIFIYSIGQIVHFLAQNVVPSRGLEFFATEEFQIGHAVEPIVLYNILNIQSVQWIFFKDQIQQIQHGRRRIYVIAHRIRIFFANRLIQCELFHIIVKKWIFTGNHFVNDDAQRPMIDFIGMSRILNDFGGDVVGCTTKGKRLFTFRNVFGKSKIDQDGIPIFVEHDVFRFQISKDVFSILQKAKGIGQQVGVEFRLPFGNTRRPFVRFFVLLMDDIPQFTTLDQPHEHIHRIGSFVHVYEIGNEGMMQFLKCLAFTFDFVGRIFPFFVVEGLQFQSKFLSGGILIW
mmetsp:Transcript_2996/g.4326  ORF Transcript_2996/g.4326 Transcript_2996/m.4326 type:complete len:347 (-) Transcript_2996:975-2015(-)